MLIVGIVVKLFEVLESWYLKMITLVPLKLFFGVTHVYVLDV